MLSQDIHQVMRLFIPIYLMEEGELEVLITEVELTENTQFKMFAVSFLEDALPASFGEPGVRLARRIRNGDEPLLLAKSMSEWVEEDPEGALAWFQTSQSNGTLFGKGIQSPEASLGGVLAGELAKKDLAGAFALLDSVEASGRTTVLAGIAKVLAEQGRDGWEQLVDPIAEMRGSDSVDRVVGAVVRTMEKGGQRNEVLAFLESIEVSPSVKREALVDVVSSVHSKESVAQRMSWLQDNVGELSYQKTVKTAVKELYRSDSVEVRNWIDELPRGELRDAALVSESSAMMLGFEEQEAFERVEQIEDETTREKQRKDLIKRWKRIDPGVEIPAVLTEQGEGSR